MGIRPGYKLTEVGTIPEEWEVQPLAALFNFSGGFAASRAQLSSHGHCYLHYGDIHNSSKTFIDVGTEYEDIPKLNITLKRVSATSLLDDGDVVFVDASEDDDGASKHIVVVNKEGITYISGLHTIVAKSTGDSLDHSYRRYCFQTRDIKRQFYFYAVGTKVSGISKTNIAKLLLPVPPLPEQRAIATALGEIEALIGGLDQLIAKKRDVKQAAMQRLLTGKQRLPGSYGKWEVASVDRVALRMTGCWGSTTADDRNRHGVHVIRAGDISVAGNLTGTALRFFSDGELTKAQCTLGDVVITTSGNGLGKTWLSDGRLGIAASNFTRILRPMGHRIHGPFLFYTLRSELARRMLQEHTATSAYPNLRPSFFSSEWIPLPDHDEQAAIATVLSDMDAELAVLERRRDKTRDLKQTMMQTLLAGTTRLT